MEVDFDLFEEQDLSIEIALLDCFEHSIPLCFRLSLLENKSLKVLKIE